jgi:hypothetical protein
MSRWLSGARLGDAERRTLLRPMLVASGRERVPAGGFLKWVLKQVQHQEDE